MGLKLLPPVLSLIAGSADVIGFFGLGGLTTVLVAGLGVAGRQPLVSLSPARPLIGGAPRFRPPPPHRGKLRASYLGAHVPARRSAVKHFSLFTP